MKKIVYLVVLSLLTALTFAEETNHEVKEVKFKFKAGAASSLNFYKQIHNEIGYKKVSIGNGLGTELGYNFNKRLSINAHYYMHYFKNEVKSDVSFLQHEFKINQQNHFVAISLGVTLFQKKTMSLIFNTGPGFVIKNEQKVLINGITNEPYKVVDQKLFKYAQPIAFNLENFIKNKIILGFGVQTFIIGEKQPVKGVTLFSYLGLPF